MSIIKRKKQNKFFMMSNAAAQQDLENLASIGLLAYIISLPEDFRLYKTYLQNKFSRRTVDGAFKELLEKKYIAGFSCYIDRKKQYFYLASDEQLNDREFNIFVHETFYEYHNQGKTPKNLQIIKDCQLQILIDFSAAQNVQHTNAHSVQYNEYRTPGTEQNERVQINNTNKQEQTHITNIINNDYPPFYNWLEN